MTKQQGQMQWHELVNLELESWRQAEPWHRLASQPTLLGKFQTSEGFFLKTKRKELKPETKQTNKDKTQGLERLVSG